MNAKRDLTLVLKLQDQVSKELKGVQGKIESLQPTFRKMAAIGTTAFAGVTAAVGKSVAEFAKFEQAQVAFESMLGSAEEAKKMIEDLSQFSAKTPFQFEDIVQATRTLVAFGDTGEAAKEKLSFLGDIASGAQVPLADLAQIFGKVQTKGKAMTEEILQMSERGIPVIDALAEQFGVGKDAIFEMAETGQLSAEIVEEALRGMTADGAIFADQMEKQSRTISGLFSTLKDNVSLTMAAIGESFSVEIGFLIEKTTEVAGALKEWIEENPKLARNIIIVTGAVAGLVAVVGAVGLVLPAVITGFTFLSGPVGLAAGAIAGLSGVFVLLAGDSDMLGGKIGELIGWLEDETGVVTILKEAWDNVVLMFQERLMPALSELWEALKPLQPFIETFAQIVGVILYGAFIALIKLIEVSLIVTIELLTLTIEKATEWVNEFKDDWDSFTDTLSTVITWIDKVIEKIKQLNVLQSAKNFISGALGFGGGRANGGPVSAGTSYIVGERGPEMFVPNSSGSIVPNNMLSGSGMSINIVVNGDVSGQELIETVKRGIMQDLRMNAKLPA